MWIWQSTFFMWQPLTGEAGLSARRTHVTRFTVRNGQAYVRLKLPGLHSRFMVATGDSVATTAHGFHRAGCARPISARQSKVRNSMRYGSTRSRFMVATGITFHGGPWFPSGGLCPPNARHAIQSPSDHKVNGPAVALVCIRTTLAAMQHCAPVVVLL